MTRDMKLWETPKTRINVTKKGIDTKHGWA